MTEVADRFTAAAPYYDKTVHTQPIIANHLAARLSGAPKRILEIGCGTGGLSAHLLNKFPESELVLSDISPSMLALCARMIGTKARYQLIDVEALPPSMPSFDLIVSSMALQWVLDLQQTLKNLISHLSPGGQLAFALLGDQNFKEWRALLQQSGVTPGLHEYPSVEGFCWPAPYHGRIEEELLQEHHENGRAFLKSLKKMGAATPRAGHRPVSPAAMRRALKASEAGFTVSYHVLYGSLTLPSNSF